MSDLYVRINKQWTTNSGWAQPSWLYFIDVANSQGDVLPGNLHGGMGKYGLTEGEAERLAARVAVFLGLPVRRFEEQRNTTVTMKETRSEDHQPSAADQGSQEDHQAARRPLGSGEAG